MSVLDGPGEGTWSVFAAKVVEERDQLRDHIESLKAQLECAQAFHDVAVKERDLAITQIASAMREREELNRLRRLTPTGTYTLNIAHEEELERMREAIRAAEKRELEALAELDEAKAAIRLVLEADCLKSHAFERGDDDASVYELCKSVVGK